MSCNVSKERIDDNTASVPMHALKASKLEARATCSTGLQLHFNTDNYKPHVFLNEVSLSLLLKPKEFSISIITFSEKYI